MRKRIGPSGWQPHAIMSRPDGYVSVNGSVPDFIAKMITPPLARTTNRSIAAIRARMVARQRAYERTKTTKCLDKEYHYD